MWWVCSAFPKGIPVDDAFAASIAASGHREPLPGDHGIRFEAGKPRLPWDDDEEGAA
jgi:hypothetical protein